MEPGRPQLADQAAPYLHTNARWRCGPPSPWISFAGVTMCLEQSELEIEDLASEVEAIPAGR